MDKTVTSVVDRLVRWRSMISIILGAFVVTRSSSIFIFDLTQRGLRVTISSSLSLAAWLVWFAILLLFALFAGGIWRSAAVRERLNDEGTVANWRAALLGGYWFMMVGAAICIFTSFYLPLTARGAVQVMVSLGVGMSLIRFGGLERRAFKE